MDEVVFEQLRNKAALFTLSDETDSVPPFPVLNTCRSDLSVPFRDGTWTCGTDSCCTCPCPCVCPCPCPCPFVLYCCWLICCTGADWCTCEGKYGVEVLYWVAVSLIWHPDTLPSIPLPSALLPSIPLPSVSLPLISVSLPLDSLHPGSFTGDTVAAITWRFEIFVIFDIDPVCGICMECGVVCGVVCGVLWGAIPFGP